MKKKTLDFSDIEDISQISSSVQSHHPSPPRDIKREPVELPQTIEADRIVQNKQTSAIPQQRTYWQVAFDDLDGEDIQEEPLNAVLIQEEQLPQIVPELIEEPQYIEQYFEDFNQNQNQEIEPPKQKTTQPQQQQQQQQQQLQKMTINTMNNNNPQKGRIYNPKKSLIYLRLQGKEDLYRKQEIIPQDPHTQDELIDDLVCISNLMLNLSIKRQKIEQNEKPIMQIHQVKKKPIQPKEETKETRKVNTINNNDAKQQVLDRQKRMEQLQQQKQLLKILNQKQVYDITTKKLSSSGMVLYRVKLKEKQRDFVQWLRFSEIAQISKGLESIFAFEKRLSDQHYYNKQKIQEMYQHRIVGGQLLKGVKVYQNSEIFDNQYKHKPIPNKINEEETKITVNKSRGSKRRNLSDIVLEHEQRRKLKEEQKNEQMEDENNHINQELDLEQEQEQEQGQGQENELNSDDELIRKQNEEERRKRRAERVRQRRQTLRMEKELLEQEKQEFLKHKQQQQQQDQSNQRDSIQKSECKSNKSQNKNNDKQNEKDQQQQAKKIKKEHDLLDADEIKIFKVSTQNERQTRIEKREQQNTSAILSDVKKPNTNVQKPKPLFKTAPVLSRLETTEQLKKKQIILDKRKLKQLKEESKKNNEVQSERKSEQKVETRKSVSKQEVKKQQEYISSKRQYDLPHTNSKKKINRRKIIDDDTSEEVIRPQQRGDVRKLVRI